VSDVILLGDSIRIGYQETVREQLSGRASVWAPVEATGNSDNLRSRLDEWVLSRDADLVHINVGLHDIKKPFDTGIAAVPLERYAENVRAILMRLKNETETALVWALNTPVNYEWHHRTKRMDRFEEDVVAYNAAALDICRDLGVAVNDLFSLVDLAGRDDLLLPDGVHFKPEGYALLGGAVAECVRSVLANSR